MKTRKRKQPLVMIVDPDEEERFLLRAILKLIGFTVIEAFDTSQIQRLAQEQRPDLLIVDIPPSHLRRVDGMFTIRKQALLRSLPIGPDLRGSASLTESFSVAIKRTADAQ